MADLGSGPNDLIRRRNEVEIKRLEHMMASQELQVMEKQEEIRRIEENIEASKKEIEKQRVNISALDGPGNEKKVNA